VNAGTYLLEAEVLDAIPAGRPVSIERETFPQLIAAGKSLYAYTTSDYWIDLGKPEAYLGAHRDIFDGRMPLGLQPGANGPGVTGVPSSAIIPPVFVGRNVRVAPDAKIGPYTVLGDNCDVASGAVVTGSLLWDGVIVESGARLDEAIVASRAHIGSGAVIGRGSVIGHDANIAPHEAVGEDARIPANS
jgi:mannose-1-phosphate guanylyltransferase